MRLIGDPRGLRLALAHHAGGIGVGLGEGLGPFQVGPAADLAGPAFPLGPGGRGDPLALAADLLEDGGADLLRVVQPAQPDVDDRQAELLPGLFGHAPRHGPHHGVRANYY